MDTRGFTHQGVTAGRWRAMNAGALEVFWSDRRIALVSAVLVAIVAGLVAAWLTPRGPITTFEALAWMGLALGTGALGGFLPGSRWSLLLIPGLFVAAFELARLGTPGPTVEGIHLDTTYGIIAFVVGRGASYVLALLPVVLGCLLGVELASRLGRSGTRRLGIVGWLISGVLGIALLAMAASLAQPARTPAILGADGRILPGSVAELASLPIGGHQQTVMIRGRSDQDPVLLHLAGGPGGTDIGAMRADTSLEQDLVVATWDQRGTGKSYAALDPVGTLTLQQMVADTIELTEYLRERFDEERIYLTGNSWGSLLGVLAVQARPDLYHAWIGSGQMVSPRETDGLFYADTLAWAEATGDTGLAETLRANGPPPYADMLAYEPALSHEHDWNVYPEWDSDREMPFNLFVPENALMDQLNGLRAFLDTFSVLYPQIQDVDLRQDAATLGVPVYVVAGRHEARGRAVPLEQWFGMLEAPSKELIVMEHSGHRPMFEEPAVAAQLMARIVDETYDAE